MKSTIISLLLAGSLNASQFTAFYLFDDGSSIAAKFSGTRNGNLITDLGDMSLYVAGTWWPDGYLFPVKFSSFTDGGYNLAEGGATMSMDGTYMNFRLATDNLVDEGEDWCDWNGVWSAYTPLGFTSLYYYQAGGNYTWDAARWSVQEVEELAFSFSARSFAPVATVPEGGALTVFALALAGMAWVRRVAL